MCYRRCLALLLLVSITELSAAPVKKESPSSKYEKISETDARQINEATRMESKAIGNNLGLKFTELQTDHYLIYTDWDPREHSFLKRNMEEAYAVVAKQFNLPCKENVFVGKLPVFMIRSEKDFMQFAIKVDRFAAGKGVAGYFGGREDGLGHLVMFKPEIEGGDVAQAKLEWAYVLAHENTHAFVSCYHGHRFVATWLNEGIAEATATRSVPKLKTDYREKARAMAHARAPLSMIFDGDAPKAAEWYPVMQTVTEMLAMDHKAFLAMFDDIKEGMKPEEALQKHYHMDFKQVQARWYQYMR